MLEKNTITYEKTVLIGIVSPSQDEEKAAEYLDELAFLTYTAGGEVVKRFIQKIDVPNPKTFIGSGKMNEITDFVRENGI
ncbi:MAG: GTPase HflX, partial [Sinomicrobium sp.]|nr:GTPase HflX [Sinomicrobium sp.]